MTANHTIIEILDETTQALIDLDMPELLALEKRAKLWAASTISFETLLTASFQQKNHQLSLILAATASNLNLFYRVIGKEAANQWVL